MKTLSVFLCAMVLVFGVVGTANSALTKIGTATYNGSDYNLIYEDDSIDGGLVWLDYRKMYYNNTWQNAVNWESSLGSNLTVNLDPGYTTDIDWGAGWRLPLTQDPTVGYNITGSEMGHLYYESLEKLAGGPLGNASPFSELQTTYYWSGTDYSLNPRFAWIFPFNHGNQQTRPKNFDNDAMAVRPATVSVIPIPSAVWLLGSSCISLVGFRKKIRKA